MSVSCTSAYLKSWTLEAVPERRVLFKFNWGSILRSEEEKEVGQSGGWGGGGKELSKDVVQLESSFSLILWRLLGKKWHQSCPTLKQGVGFLYFYFCQSLVMDCQGQSTLGVGTLILWAEANLPEKGIAVSSLQPTVHSSCLLFLTGLLFVVKSEESQDQW